MGKVMDYQCPGCKSPLHYDSKNQNWPCSYCGKIYTLEELKKYTTSKNEKNDDLCDDYVTYNCPDCGATVVCDSTTSATFCIYCGNTSILKNRLSGEFKPSKIIPFKNTKDDAIKAFTSLNKGRIFMPKFFNDPKNIEKIRGVYIPFWLYDIDISGSLNCDGKRITSWTSGEYQYTKTDVYKFFRTGSLNFKNIPVDGSLKFENDMMNSLEPFNFSELVEYDHAYLSGFLAEMYDVNKDEAFNDANSRSKNSTKEVFMNSISASGVVPFEDTLSSTVKSCDYVLLPVWMVNVKFKDKMYLFAMNGQTGEIVGNIPLNKKKIIIFGFISFVFCFIIFALVCFLINLGGGI